MVDELIQPSPLLPEIVSIRPDTTSPSEQQEVLQGQQLVITISESIRGAAGVKGHGDDEGNGGGGGGETVTSPPPSSSPSMLYAAFVDLQLVSQQREEGRAGKGGNPPLDYSSSDSEQTPAPPPTLIIENVQLSQLEERDNDGRTFVCASPQLLHGEGRSNPPQTVILLDVRPPLMETVSQTIQGMCNDAWEEMLSTATYSSGEEEGGDTLFGGGGGSGSSGGIPRPVFFASSEEDHRTPGSIRPLSQLSRFAYHSCAFARLVSVESSDSPPQQQQEVQSPSPAVGGPNSDDDINKADNNGDGSTTESSWTEWMKRPRLGKDEEKLERDAMTFDEVAAALTDVHGSLGVPGDSENSRGTGSCGSIPCGDGGGRNKKKRHVCSASREHLLRFDAALTSLDDEVKKAVVLAQERCPDQVGDEEKALFLRGQNTDDPEKAALKFCQHWNMRLELFGTDKAFLPLTIQGGALKDEKYMLLHRHDVPGWFVPLLMEDRFGRAIIYTTGPKACPTTEARLSLLRVVWYMGNLCLRNMTDVRKGIVVLVDLTNARLSETDIGLIRQLFRVVDVLPMEVRAFHHIRFPWFHSLVHPVVNHLKGKKLRTRTVFHSGSESEVLARLERYGLDASRLPKALGGDIVLDPNWIRQREAFAVGEH